MSLLQRVEASVLPKEHAPIKNELVTSSGSRAEKINYASTSRISNEFPKKEASALGVVQHFPDVQERKSKLKESRSNRDHSIAIGLISEVASILPTLMHENEELRAKIEQLEEQHEKEVESATLIACEWRRTAESSKAKIEVLENRLHETSERLKTAERLAESQGEAALRSSKEAAEAECLAELFEEKLISSFGIGSMFQAALERVRQRSETEVP